MGQLISVLRMTAEGPRMKIWEVPDELELEPGPDWVEQSPSPLMSGMLGGAGGQPPQAQR